VFEGAAQSMKPGLIGAFFPRDSLKAAALPLQESAWAPPRSSGSIPTIRESPGLNSGKTPTIVDPGSSAASTNHLARHSNRQDRLSAGHACYVEV
jgi:hypothetical protein